MFISFLDPNTIEFVAIPIKVGNQLTNSRKFYTITPRIKGPVILREKEDALFPEPISKLIK